MDVQRELNQLVSKLHIYGLGVGGPFHRGYVGPPAAAEVGDNGIRLPRDLHLRLSLKPFSWKVNLLPNLDRTKKLGCYNFCQSERFARFTVTSPSSMSSSSSSPVHPWLRSDVVCPPALARYNSPPIVDARDQTLLLKILEFAMTNHSTDSCWRRLVIHALFLTHYMHIQHAWHRDVRQALTDIFSHAGDDDRLAALVQHVGRDIPSLFCDYVRLRYLHGQTRNIDAVTFVHSIRTTIDLFARSSFVTNMIGLIYDGNALIDVTSVPGGSHFRRFYLYQRLVTLKPEYRHRELDFAAGTTLTPLQPDAHTCIAVSLHKTRSYWATLDDRDLGMHYRLHHAGGGPHTTLPPMVIAAPCRRCLAVYNYAYLHFHDPYNRPFPIANCCEAEGSKYIHP